MAKLVGGVPKCPECGYPARYVNCSNCGANVRSYKEVKKETDKEKLIGEEKPEKEDE